MQVDRPRIIAEIGCNHGGSRERAIDMAQDALAAGADWVKFQHFNPRKLSEQRKNPAIERIATLSPDDLAKVLKVIPSEKRMVTIFGQESAKQALVAGASILKVSHVESRDLDFLEFIRLLCPNFVYSTTDTHRNVGDDRVLYTLAEYPCEQFRAMYVAWWAAKEGAGYSDHTQGDDLSAAIHSVRLKCWATEVHVHEDGCVGCVDHAVSKSMNDLRRLVEVAKEHV